MRLVRGTVGCVSTYALAIAALGLVAFGDPTQGSNPAQGGWLVGNALAQSVDSQLPNPAPSQTPNPAPKAVIDMPTAVLSGFSGVHYRASRDLGAAGSVDRLFINPDGASVTLTGINGVGFGFAGLEIRRLPYHQITARSVGQIFGLAVDDAQSPNLYMAATSAFGLPIVGQDRNEDGVPDKLYSGRQDARFMDGLFGPNRDNGPGSIWKMDGVTGTISLFASIKLEGRANSGPGLGNISFDPESGQLFVSDLDTGMIFRLDTDGHVLESFDHGVTARAMEGLSSVPFDPANRLDIKDRSFDVEDPSSWHLAKAERRVWGLAANRGRLYYAVAQGPEIWSVGIAPQDGAFQFDARREFRLPNTLPALEISDIVFAPDGTMILAQRGERQGSFDFSRLARPRQAQVLRVRRATDETWSRSVEPYGIGFANDMNNGNGGVAIGPGYQSNGTLDPYACATTLWSTGEQLRMHPDLSDRLRQGGALNVAGVQAHPLALTVEQNGPPWLAHFFDFDEVYPKAQTSGQIGDVEIVGCAAMAQTQPMASTPDNGVARDAEPEFADRLGRQDKLVVDLSQVGNCLTNREARSFSCDFTLSIKNAGDWTHEGPLALIDRFNHPLMIQARLLAGVGWRCSEARSGFFTCLHPQIAIEPGAEVQLTVRLLMSGQKADGLYRNCLGLGAGQGRREQVTLAQLLMEAYDIASGGVDGSMGPNTRRGLRKLQSRLGLVENGELAPNLFHALGVPLVDSNKEVCVGFTLAAMPMPGNREPSYGPARPMQDTDGPPVMNEPLVIERSGPNRSCDPVTTVRKGKACFCRFPGMERKSPTRCASPVGSVFDPQSGCQPHSVRPLSPQDQCNPLTTVDRGARCICRYPGMQQVTATECQCRGGSVFVAGRGCVFDALPIAPIRPIQPLQEHMER